MGMLLGYMDGYEALVEGDTQKAVEKFAPALLRNVAIWNKLSEEGAKDWRGNSVIPVDDYHLGLEIARLIGFNSDKLANAQEIGFRASAVVQRIYFERARLLKTFNRVYTSDSSSGGEKIEARIDEFNKKYPGYAITEDNKNQSLKTSGQNQDNSVAGVVLDDKTDSITGLTSALMSTQK
tara:strand:- start:27 stop:566 length:540 start_codon:yes stop_codon:yes gene_type:complete